MSCMTIHFTYLQISRLDIRPHIKWAVRLVILHMVTSIFLRGLSGKYYHALFEFKHYFCSDVGFITIVVRSMGQTGAKMKYGVPNVPGQCVFLWAHR